LVHTSDPKPVGKLLGTIAVSALADGYGFIEPDGGGGQILVRLSSIDSNVRLRVGEYVRYELAAGSFAVEAVAVTAVTAVTNATG
jgi:cold shock CspA family protein